MAATHLTMSPQGISIERVGLTVLTAEGGLGGRAIRVTGASGPLIVGRSLVVWRRLFANSVTHAMRSSGSGAVAFLISVSRTRGEPAMEEAAAGRSPAGVSPVSRRYRILARE